MVRNGVISVWCIGIGRSGVEAVAAGFDGRKIGVEKNLVGFGYTWVISTSPHSERTLPPFPSPFNPTDGVASIYEFSSQIHMQLSPSSTRGEQRWGGRSELHDFISCEVT